MAIDMHDLDRTRELLSELRPIHDALGPQSDYAELVGWFESNALPAPPIPAPLRGAIKQQTPTVWSTIQLDPWRLVDNDRAVEALEHAGGIDHIVIGHVCRNSAQSRVTYQIVHRGIALVATCLWRYDHHEHDAEVIDQTFFAIDALLSNLDPNLEPRRHDRPGLLVEAHGRSVRWWRTEHEQGAFQNGPDADGRWQTLIEAVCVENPSWRVRSLDVLPRA